MNGDICNVAYDQCDCKVPLYLFGPDRYCTGKSPRKHNVLRLGLLQETRLWDTAVEHRQEQSAVTGEALPMLRLRMS